MYKTIIHIHSATSLIFTILALVLSARAVTAWLGNKPYIKADVWLTECFMIFLYIELIFGIALYFFISPVYKSEITSIAEAQKNADLRFWAIEHFSVMVLALILSFIGRIFTHQLKRSQSRHKYAAFYFGSATLLTLFSLLFYLF